MKPSSRPNGWADAILGEVVEINPRSFIGPLAEDQPISFLPMAAVEAMTGRLDTSRSLTYGQIKSGYTLFADGDILFAKITPCMENGKIAVARSLTNGVGCGSTEFHVLRPTAAVTPEFIAYFLLRDSFRKDARGNMTGTAGQLRVPAAFLEHSPFPLPPLPEQRRIVAEIEKHFTRLDAATAALKRAKANLARYRASLLKAAVDGRLVPTEAELARREGRSYEPASVLLDRILKDRRQKWESQPGRKGKYKEPEPPDTNGLRELPERWVWASLRQMGDLDRGRSKHRPRNDLKLYGGEYPFIQTGDIRQSGGVVRSHEQTYNEAGLAQSRLWPAGTLCITIAANIAETAILAYPACFPDSVVGFESGDRQITGFVQIVLQVERAELDRSASATAQKNINLQVLSRIRVPLPPIAELGRIVGEVDRNLSIIAVSEQAITSAFGRVEALRQAILSNAFKGRLVLQDHSDEPASVLLERIRKERQTASENGRRPHRRRPVAVSAE